jgi:hypothetical protein
MRHMKHESHNWSPTGFCSACSIYGMSMDAIYECRPSSAERETQEPIDQTVVTAGVSME